MKSSGRNETSLDFDNVDSNVILKTESQLHFDLINVRVSTVGYVNHRSQFHSR